MVSGHVPYKRWLAPSRNNRNSSYLEDLTQLSVTFTPGINSKAYRLIEDIIIQNTKQFGFFQDADNVESAMQRLFFSYDEDLSHELYKDFPKDEDGSIKFIEDDVLRQALSDKCHKPRVLYFKFLGDSSGNSAIELGIDSAQLLTISDFIEPSFEFNVDHPLFSESGDADSARVLKWLGEMWREFGTPITGKKEYRTVGWDVQDYWTFDNNNKIETSALFGSEKERELITQASAIFNIFGELVSQSLELNFIPGIRNTPENPIAIDSANNLASIDAGKLIWATLARDLAQESVSKLIEAGFTDLTLKKINQALFRSGDLNIGLDLGYRLKLTPNLSMTVTDFLSLQQKNIDKEELGSIRDYLKSVSLHVEDQHGRRLDLEDVGTGVSQLIPVLWSAISPSLKGVVHVQQPELHLHPALQMRLADQFLLNREGKELTWIIETHSEHFILRILKRIRQTAKLGDASPIQIRPNDVVVLYIWKDPEHGSRVAHMKITSDGDFEDRWPHGFFEERTDEWLD